MKKLLIFVCVLALAGIFSAGASAQMMQQRGTALSGTSSQGDGHTAKEEAEGRAIWDKLQAKELSCADLKDDDFERLGEYFMGQMLGSSHESMNEMMSGMMGVGGEEAMHAVMGKRLSGCDTSAAWPSGAQGFMPMMNMLGGFGGGQMWSAPMMQNGGGSSLNKMGWSSPYGDFGTNMGYGYNMPGFGLLGLFFMLLWWAFVVTLLVLGVRWLMRQTRGGSSSALDIARERYAKGEIDKKEFEEKKKELSN